MMKMFWLAVFLLAVGAVQHSGAAEQALSGAEAEAAREGIQEALDFLVLSAGKFLSQDQRDSLSLPPSLYEEERRWAGGIVKISVKHDFTNLTFTRLSSVRRAGDIGVDPLTGTGGNATFTLPLELNEPHVTGDFLFKVSGVGPSGDFDATIGEYKLEAEGTVAVTHNACSVQFNRVHEIEIGKVDTKMQGATVFLNAPLAPVVTSDIGKGKLGFQSKVNEALLQALQEQAGKLDCTPVIQRHIRKIASNS